MFIFFSSFKSRHKSWTRFDSCMSLMDDVGRHIYMFCHFVHEKLKLKSKFEINLICSLFWRRRLLLVAVWTFESLRRTTTKSSFYSILFTKVFWLCFVVWLLFPLVHHFFLLLYNISCAALRCSFFILFNFNFNQPTTKSQPTKQHNSSQMVPKDIKFSFQYFPEFRWLFYWMFLANGDHNDAISNRREEKRRAKRMKKCEKYEKKSHSRSARQKNNGNKLNKLAKNHFLRALDWVWVLFFEWVSRFFTAAWDMRQQADSFGYFDHFFSSLLLSLLLSSLDRFSCEHRK